MIPIPIVLLHHNELNILRGSIKRILSATRYPFLLFVVDNKSDSDNSIDFLLDEFGSNEKIIFVKNDKNNWIYGFNKALDNLKWPNANYYVFSDADVMVPNFESEDCWLGRLVDQMEKHRIIGKLGVSLDLSNLEKNPKLSSTLKMERSFYMGPKIGDNYIAAVDTTMAIYRPDYFIGKFRFRIGHQTLFKPFYYTCRTSADFQAVHVGWDFYPGSKSEKVDPARYRAKAIAMSKMGTHTAPEIMKEINFFSRCYCYVMRDVMRAVHGIKVTSMIFAYVCTRFPRRLNEIMAQSRDLRNVNH